MAQTNPLKPNEQAFLENMLARPVEQRLLRNDMKPRIKEQIDDLVNRGYCKYQVALVMGRPTGDTIIAVTEAGQFVLETLKATT